MRRIDKKLLIVDGHNLLFQMFFGMPSKILAKNGMEIQGIIGFVGAVNKLLNMVKPTHALVLFDSETHNPRCDLLPDYKANRPDYSSVPDSENPFSILPYIYDALSIMQIKHTEIKDAEVDDVIASYAISKHCDTEIVISSFDSDYFQLISDTVKVLRYRGDNSAVCDEEYVKKRYGVCPRQYADFKALVGDSADNIKGVCGIGKKTASKILSECPSLDEFFSGSVQLSNEKLAEKLNDYREQIERNISLIKLDCHAPLPFSPQELIISEQRMKTMDVVRSIGL